VRIGFYYEGTDGTNWYVDEVVVTDSDWGNTTDLSEYELEGGEMSDGIGNPEIEDGRNEGDEDKSETGERKESRKGSERGSSGSKERDGGDESEKSESQDPEKREERVA